jgi:DMSO/TMAO reductase YedYZ molybdopterin-dependent catalytic subunit
MSNPPISRGFRGRGRAGQSARVPPGQHLVSDFPVLSAGPTPEVDLANWRFTLEDGETPIGEWRWAEFNALPLTEVKVDIHCVTTWSKLDTNWRGVSIDTLLEATGPSEPLAPFVLAHCDGGRRQSNRRHPL